MNNRNHNIWAISRPKSPVHVDLRHICGEANRVPFTTYEISDLGKYLLSPSQVEIKNRLLGCEIRYRPTFTRKIREKTRKIFVRKRSRSDEKEGIPAKMYLSQMDYTLPPLRDEKLKAQFKRIHDHLRSYDPIIRELSALETTKIDDVVGITENILGDRSLLVLRGTVEEKIEFVKRFLSEDVGIVFKSACISEGLFEMRGYDFRTYNPDNRHRLVKFSDDGDFKVCVLGPDNQVESWVQDVSLLQQMLLFEQSLQKSSVFYESVKQCMEGKATALKLFFYKQLDINYSKTYLPTIYRNVFRSQEVAPTDIDKVLDSLNNLQMGISFHYVPESDSGEKKMCTTLSVMHDFRALEPIKEELPFLYSEINKAVSVSEAGKYYLLDSIKGYQNG
jgi:hypothetical protein